MANRLTPLTVRLPEKMHRFCEQAAAEDGVTTAEWIRTAIMLRMAWRISFDDRNASVAEVVERVIGELGIDEEAHSTRGKRGARDLP